MNWCLICVNEWVCEQMDEIGEWLIEWMSSELLR